MAKKPEYVRGMSGDNAKYFEKGRGHGSDYDKGANQYTGNEKLQKGFSRVAHQDAPDPVAYTQTRTARKGGGFDLGEKQYIYEKVKAPEQVAAAPVPEPTPEPAKEQPAAPVTPSNTLQSAINTVKANKGRDFSFGTGDRDAERRALTDSFSQKSYDPEAGIASEEAGDFLDDYKLNLKQKLNPNPNGGE